MPMSCVSGCMKMPSDCRRPMLRVSISEAPIRMGSVGRRTLQQGHCSCSPSWPPVRNPHPAIAPGLITPICVIKLQPAAAVKGQRTQVCVQMSRSEKTDMKERILETADRLFYLQRHSRGRRRHHRRRNRHHQAHALQPLPLQGRADLGLSGASLHAGAAAVGQAAGRTDSRRRSTRLERRFRQQGFSRLPVRQRGGRTRRGGPGGEARSRSPSRKAAGSGFAICCCSSASPIRKASRRSSRCSSTARSRRTWCATIPSMARAAKQAAMVLLANAGVEIGAEAVETPQPASDRRPPAPS